MEIKDWIITIVVVIGIAVGTAAGSSLSETELLKPKTEFAVNVEYSINNSTHGERLKFFNIGNAQAKNAVLFITSKEPIRISYDLCLESKEIFQKADIFHKIEFEKFSTNVDCVLEFYNSPNKNIINIIATADETKGYQHVFDDQKQHDLVSLIINFFSPYVLIVLSYSFATIAALYLINRRREFRKRSEFLRKEEKDGEKEIERYQQEFNLIENRINEVGSKNIPEEMMARRAHLIEESKQLRNELDEIQVIKNQPLMIKQIGDFFDNWFDVEKKLRSLVGLESMRGRYQTITNLLNELKNKSLISEQEVTKLNSAFQYRNELIHGKIKPNKKEIEKFNQELTEILPQLYKIIPHVVGDIVRIPAGSSVPGCEETDECYIPSKTTIKEGQIVTWMNNDTAAHSVTSGTQSDGPDGIFDSSLFMSQNTFSYRFEKKGTYHYFCLVHPWQKGVIEVI